MLSQLRTAILMTIVLTVLTGVVYPLLVTGLAGPLFPVQAGGSLVVRDGSVIGSSLIAQPFASDRYFHPRPSAAGDKGYDPTASGGSNLGPIDRRLIDRVRVSATALHQEHLAAAIPVDLVTTSGSGLDPHITHAAAEFQVPRVAHVRGMSVDTLRALVRRYTEDRQFGLLGEPRVNVLRLNLALDAATAQ